MTLTFDIFLHIVEVNLTPELFPSIDHFGRFHRSDTIVVEPVSHSRESLRGRKGPHSPIPFALSNAVGAEPRVPLLGCGNAVRSTEAAVADELEPRRGVASVVGGSTEIPRQVSNLLPHMRRRVADDHATCPADGLTDLIETGIGIPKTGADEGAESIGEAGVALCRGVVAGQTGCGSDGLSIAVHVAVDARTRVLLTSPATDRFLHGVANVVLPVQSFPRRSGPAVVVPVGELPFHLRQQADE